MAFKVCCSCNRDPYNVRCSRVLCEGEPLNTDTTISGYDREWFFADFKAYIGGTTPIEFWGHVAQSSDLVAHPSASIWHYDVKCKPFRYRIAAILPDTSLNHPDHRRETGPPAKEYRHFVSARSSQFEFISPIRSGANATGAGYDIRTVKSTYDYARLTINGTAYAVTSLAGSFTRGVLDGQGQFFFDCPSTLYATLTSGVDVTNADIYVDLWITSRIATTFELPDPSDAYWDGVGITEPDNEGRGLSAGYAPASFSDYGSQASNAGRVYFNVGPNRLGFRKYQLTFDRGDIGGETSVIIGRRSDPIVSSTFNSRPSAYDGSAVFTPAISNWLNVDDSITKPSAGDGVYATKSGAANETQGYIGTSITAGTIPTGSGTITRVFLHVLAHCAVADGDSWITGYYTRINGSQVTVSGLTQSLTTTPTWYTWERTSLSGLTDLPMVSNPRFGISFAGTDGSSSVSLDAIYLEVQYDEAPEWEYERNDAAGTQLLRHNASGDYVELQFGDELPRILFVKPSLAVTNWQGACVYRKNTETHYYKYQNTLTVSIGGTPTSFPYEIYGDAWDRVTEADFAVNWRLQSGGSPSSPEQYFPGGGMSTAPIPGYSVFDPNGSLFIDFPAIITIAPI